MGLLPSFDIFDGINVKATLSEFFDLVTSINDRLGQLVDIERDKVSQARLARATAARQAAEAAPCSECNEVGRLRCRAHGQPGFQPNDHEIDDRLGVTFCPITARTGETRDHQVRLDGTVVGCHPADDDKLAPR